MVEFFFFKQKTAYEIYQCDWSSDVCSSDLWASLQIEEPDIFYWKPKNKDGEVDFVVSLEGKGDRKSVV